MSEIDKREQGAANYVWGALAENIAADYLRTRGYTIREQNYRYKTIEIDLIAEKDGDIIFVEVKARTGNFEDPLSAVDKNKRRHMIIGADLYLRSLEPFYWYRFDIITITGTPDNYTIEHYPDAFLPPVHTKVHAVSRRVSNRRSKS